MENKNVFPAIVLMPSNRVNGFLAQMPVDCVNYVALVNGIRCREEAYAVFDLLSAEALHEYLKSFPKDAAVRYCYPAYNPEGKAKICSFTMQFDDDPQLYAVWCQCSKVVAGLSADDLKKLNFAIYEIPNKKQIRFLSYSQQPDDAWIMMMLQFIHHIQPEQNEWVASEIKFERCDIKSNF